MKKTFCLIAVYLVMVLLSSVSVAQVIKGTYAIKNVQTCMLLRIKDANKTNCTPLVAYSPVNWKCVTWDFQHIAGETYQLKNLFTSKTFQSKNGIAFEGVTLEQQLLMPLQLNQQYDFVLAEKNAYLIRAKGTDLYVTPVDKTGTQDTGIMLAKKNGSKIQRWIIYEQHPTM